MIPLKTSATTIGVQIDNDFLFGSDRSYTGGIRISAMDQHFEVVDFIYSPFEPSDIHSRFSTQDQILFDYQLYTFQIEEDGETEPLKMPGIQH